MQQLTFEPRERQSRLDHHSIGAVIKLRGLFYSDMLLPRAFEPTGWVPPTAAAQLVPTHDANQNQLMVDHTNQTPTITYHRRGTVGLQGGLSSSARLTRLRTTALDHSYLLITLHE